MKNQKGFLLFILLILSNSSAAQQRDRLAPEATNAEVEATADGSEVPFWYIPLLEKPLSMQYRRTETTVSQ